GGGEVQVTVRATGGTGELGRALARRLGAGAIARGHAELPIEDAAAVARALDGVDAVINAAGFTHVDRAEGEVDAAYRANRDGPAVLARACAERGLPLVHVSSDPAFGGERDAPWREDDRTGPVNVYGASKLAGERAVLAAHPGALVVRTSWLFSATGKSFVTAILRQARERPLLRVVADQHGCPTPAADL